jgi:hypothetical protein
MIFYITYSPFFDDNYFKIWLNHYIHTGLDYKILVFPHDELKFASLYPLSLNKIITEKPENCLELTIHDFLFTYDSDDNGNIVARPFKKFFNLEEGKHTPTSEFEVYEKMDGSCIICFYYNNEWIFCSRGSFTSEQAEMAEVLSKKYPIELLDKSKTYVFEIIY